MSELPRIAARELVDLLEDGRAGDELGVAAGIPLVLLEGSLDPQATQRAASMLGALPCVVLGADDGGSDGAGALAPLVDTFADDAAIAAIVAQVADSPLASVSLAMLLRSSDRLTVEDGLAAESAVYSTLQAGPEFAAWRARRPVKARPPAEGPPLLVDRTGDVLRLTLDRPHVHNAWSAGLRDASCEALQLALADPSIAVVELRGNGRSFCSGGDLDEFGSRSDPSTAHVVRLARSPARLMALVGDRVESHLHGACMGAGIELPAFGRRIVAASDTTISLPELALGLVPGAGGTVSLPRRIGRHRTALLALTGMHLDAPTARSWGLVDELA